MNPDSRFSASLALSLLFAAPTLMAAANGTLDIVTAGLRYLAAFGVAWFGVGVVGRLVNAYVAAQEPDETVDAELEEDPAGLGPELAMEAIDVD